MIWPWFVTFSGNMIKLKVIAPSYIFLFYIPILNKIPKLNIYKYKQNGDPMVPYCIHLCIWSAQAIFYFYASHYYISSYHHYFNIMKWMKNTWVIKKSYLWCAATKSFFPYASCTGEARPPTTTPSPKVWM